MSFTAELTQTWRVLELDAGGVAARTTTHRVDALRVIGASRHVSKLYTLSAGLSNLEISLDPVSGALAGNLLRLTMDQPVDLRLGSTSASLISAVRQLSLGAPVSSLFVYTVDSAVTTLRVEATAGGSLVLSLPNP